ncbi:MAG: hypothetical protein IT293_16365 [Deltaproteobacteria bacterium]|nr:hypothetical protein [Deltaproteobacteria bacterium]
MGATGEGSAALRARFAGDLRAGYLDARRIAAQLRRHAGRVPYPRLGPTLVGLADRADAQAARVAAELRALAGNADPADPTSPRDGRNHWERLSVDLADLEALKRRWVDLALRWDVDFPATAAALAEFGRTTSAMSATVRDLLARADPHAA